MHINSILKKYGVDLYINLVGAYSSRFLVDNRIKYSYHFVSKNFKSSHEFVRRIATDLHKIL